jgi:hypothetical protein
MRLAIAAILLFLLTALAYAGYVVILGQSMPSISQSVHPGLPTAYTPSTSLAEISL